MDPAEIVFTSLLIVVLFAVAGYFGWRQVQTLRGRGTGPEDRRFAVRQAWRRLCCCGLMVVVAGMLIGGFFLDRQFRELHGQALTDEYRNFARLMAVYWGFVFLVVFALLALAAVDVWAIARFGLRQHRQLQAEHQADLEEEIARLRHRRNGSG